MRVIALLVAAVVALVAGFFAMQMSSKQESPKQQAQPTLVVTTVDILVAREPIEVGAIFEDSMIDRQPWPAHLLLDGFIKAEGQDSNLVGHVARSAFMAGEPIMRSKVANPNDPSFLAANLPEGMRAVTLATDAVSGVAGYVFPGDRVDVIVTHNIPETMEMRVDKNLRATNKPDVAEMLISDARVLAVNVRQPTGKDAASSTPSTITLEVSEADVQSIRLAEKVGTLSLALRPLKDKEGGIPSPTQSQSLTQVRLFGLESSGGVRIVRGAGEKQDKENSKNRMNAMPALTVPNSIAPTP